MTTPANEWRSNFEKYLEQVCFEANPTVLDDDMPDFFDDWLGKQSGEDYIRLADEYAKHILDQHSAHLVERIENMAIVDDYGEERKIGFQIAKDQAIDIVKDNK